jgi:hypothetical protein
VGGHGRVVSIFFSLIPLPLLESRDGVHAGAGAAA